MTRFKDFDDAREQREPIELAVKGRRYLLPGDPPVSIVGRLIGANAEGGLNIQVAEAQLVAAKARLAVEDLPDDASLEERQAAEEAFAAATAAVEPLRAEQNRLLVDLLGKANADQMIADGVGYYTYNRILVWLQVAYGFAKDPAAEEVSEEGIRELLGQIRLLAEREKKPALLAMLDAAEGALAEAATIEGEGVPKAPRRKASAKRMPTDRPRPRSASRSSSKGTR